MDSSACREHIARLLAEEIAGLEALENVLQLEHEALKSKDFAALEKTAETRRDRIGVLVRIEDERRSLCRMMGHSADAPGLTSLLKWCDPKQSLQMQWKARASHVKRCRALNDRNGALVSARLKRVEGLMTALTGKKEGPSTYGPRGAYAPLRSGRIISAEA